MCWFILNMWNVGKIPAGTWTWSRWMEAKKEKKMGGECGQLGGIVCSQRPWVSVLMKALVLPRPAILLRVPHRTNCRLLFTQHTSSSDSQNGPFPVEFHATCSLRCSLTIMGLWVTSHRGRQGLKGVLYAEGFAQRRNKVLWCQRKVVIHGVSDSVCLDRGGGLHHSKSV